MSIEKITSAVSGVFQQSAKKQKIAELTGVLNSVQIKKEDALPDTFVKMTEITAEALERMGDFKSASGLLDAYKTPRLQEAVKNGMEKGGMHSADIHRPLFLFSGFAKK